MFSSVIQKEKYEQEYAPALPSSQIQQKHLSEAFG